MEITPSPPDTMENTSTASATSIGLPRPRTFPSTFTESSMSPRLKLPPIHWKLKVQSNAENWRVIANCACVVRQLSELLAQVKDEQSYIVLRERTHRNTAESTNGRVKWWSIFQMGVLVGEGIFQVWWLKRFFEVGKNSTERFGVLSRQLIDLYRLNVLYKDNAQMQSFISFLLGANSTTVAVGMQVQNSVPLFRQLKALHCVLYFHRPHFDSGPLNRIAHYDVR